MQRLLPTSDDIDPARSLVSVEDLSKHYVLPGLGRERAISPWTASPSAFASGLSSRPGREFRVWKEHAGAASAEV